MRIYVEMNENETTAHQHLWDAEKNSAQKKIDNCKCLRQKVRKILNP